MMKRLILLTCLTSCTCHLSFSQSRLVFNNDAYLVIDNGAFVVLQNSNPNAITQLGTGGRVVSEGENDRLRWMTGTSTGLYTVPFSTPTGTEFPLSLNLTAAGTGSGHITFSTYNGSTWDNNTYRPSDVTHMFDLATGAVNNSNHVIDRFWMVDALGYTAKPAATMSITYIDAEHTPAGNTIVEGSLGAQRFNSSAGVWGDYLPQGTVNTATNVVSGIPVTPGDFFRSWTLSETTSPLPVTLLGFTCTCTGNTATVSWTTASEEQVQHYHIAGSHNGSDFTELLQVDPLFAAGGSHYSVEVNNQYRYYALRTTDVNGILHTEALYTLNCGSTNAVSAYIQNGYVVIDFNTTYTGPVDAALYDASGKLVGAAGFQVNDESRSVTLQPPVLAGGIYFLQVISPTGSIYQSIKLYK